MKYLKFLVINLGNIAYRSFYSAINIKQLLQKSEVAGLVVSVYQGLGDFCSIKET